MFTPRAEDFIPLYKSCQLPVCGRVKLCTRHLEKLARLGKNRSPNHKLLFQLRLSQQPGKTAPRIIFPQCLLEVGRNAKLVVEHDAKDVCFLFSSAVSCTNCFVPRRCGYKQQPLISFFKFELFDEKKKIFEKDKFKDLFSVCGLDCLKDGDPSNQQIAGTSEEAHVPQCSHVASHPQAQTLALQCSHIYHQQRQSVCHTNSNTMMAKHTRDAV